MQKELDCLIQMGVAQLTRLLVNSETRVSSCTTQAVEADENRLSNSTKKTSYSMKDNNDSVEQFIIFKLSFGFRCQEFSYLFEFDSTRTIG